MFQQQKRSTTYRRGNVLVLTAFLMTALIAMIAFAVDIGYIEVAKVELQRSADAAAVAAAWDLIKSPSSTTTDMTTEISDARNRAVTYAASNSVLTAGPIVDSNTSNSSSGDVVIGYISNPSDPSATINTSQLNQSNAVQVTVRRTAASANGDVPLFFAKALGINSQGIRASATAALINNIGAFQSPSDGTNLGILPIALDKQTWDAMLDGGGDDQWKWDPDTKQVVSGSDGKREVNLYPQGTGAPGNRGTVDIGSNNNSTSDISRQILYGASPEDMAHFPNSQLTFDSNGHLYLNGDTGISAGIKDELTSIIGKPRIIPIFDAVSGPGNNASYEIVEFAGVRILDVKLTGRMKDKHVTLQPANVTTLGGLPTSGTQKTWYITSPAWLVR